MGFANGINGEGYLYKCDNGELTTYYFSNLASDYAGLPENLEAGSPLQVK